MKSVRFAFTAAVAVLALAASQGCGGDDGGGSSGNEQAATTAAEDPCETSLRLTKPRPAATIHSKRMQVRGRTDPEADVTVTDDYTDRSAKVSASGLFTQNVKLKVGENEVDVEAEAPNCEIGSTTVTVTRKRSAAELAAIRQQKAEERAREEAARQAYEANYKANAKTVPFAQLEKDPYDYEGVVVKYTGQVFQIAEEIDTTWMLLSVTDEGYGYWSDEIYVTYDGEINAVEDDIVTIYGRVTGQEDYETRGGGSNQVPRVKAKYIEE
jgi:hypothetical protein